MKTTSPLRDIKQVLGLVRLPSGRVTNKQDMKANIFVIDGITGNIVDRLHSDDPKTDAQKIAAGYFEKGEGKPVSKAIPTEKYPNRHGIETPTDFFIHYLI